MSDTAARLLTTFCTTFFLFHIGSKSSCLDNMKREIAYICKLVKLNENDETINHNSWRYSMKTSTVRWKFTIFWAYYVYKVDQLEQSAYRCTTKELWNSLNTQGNFCQQKFNNLVCFALNKLSLLFLLIK